MEILFKFILILPFRFSLANRMTKNWIYKTFGTISNEFWGEPVERPLLKRALAITIDLMILTVLNFLAYKVLESVAGNQGVLMTDLSITIAYLALSNSKYSGGQTIGKRIFKIQVTDEQGNEISIWRSLLRCLPVSLVMNAQLILLYFTLSYEKLFQGVVIGLTIIATGLFYFTLIKMNRQGLHDILASTQVVSKGNTIKTSKNLDFRMISGYVIITTAFLNYLIYQWTKD